MKETRKRKGAELGLMHLIGIVFGAVVGVGIFNIVQGMAAGAQAGAVVLSWFVTGVGILVLVLTFKALSDLRPDLDAGIYQYAQAGYGDYIGFNIAWGYWICTAFGNVAYAVMLNDSLGAFWPSLHDHGLPTVIIGSVLFWVMFFIIAQGVKTASLVNLLMSMLKIATLLMITVILAIGFKMDMFTSDFWGMGLGLVAEQIRSTMMVTLWCFVGIEGAVVMAARAKRTKDIGRASVWGFILAWALYVLVSLLCYGVMSQAQMSELPNPSLAYILIGICGGWAYYFVIVSVIVSLLGGWVAWTLLCAQVPGEAAMVGIFPRTFMRQNKAGVPVYGLFVSTIVMEICILVVVSAEKVYDAAYEMAGMMVLPAYLFCGLFLLRASLLPRRYIIQTTGRSLWYYRFLAIVCIVFCCWMIYSGGVLLLLSTSLFYIPGIYFYIKARREQYIRPALSRRALAIFIFLLLAGILSIILLFSGHIKL